MRKLLIIFLAFFIVSCEDFEELNTNVKSPVEVPGATLFSNAQKNLADQITEINVNMNNFNLWSQYITETTYTDEANFDIFNRTVPDNAWRVFYKDVLSDLQEAEKIILTETSVTDKDKVMKANKLYIIDILRTYTYYRMLTLWGNIPYTDALNIDNILPKYDDALATYNAILAKLNADINGLDTSVGSFTDGADVVYNGNAGAWKKFANSLKVKIAITLADVSGFDAKATIEAAVASGVFESNADNALFTYLGVSPNTNPLWVSLIASGRSDYVACKTLGDVMNSLNDPRRPYYYKDLDASGNVMGATYGASSPYPAYSHLSKKLEDPTFPSTLLDYSEIEFYLAEAAQRGYNVGGTPESHYNKAITASIMYWGGSAAAAAAYLAQSEVAYDAANWKKSIGIQAWVSFFNRGFEGWTSYRRLDYPVLPLPKNSILDTYAVRYTYPSNEQTLNGKNYTDAAGKISGGDKLTSKLFWDIH
jgi:hypothetical protein